MPSSSSTSLTTGAPWRVILAFSVPLLIGNIVQQLYQFTDAVVVGRHLGVNSLAAVGATGSVVFLVMGFAWGLTSGFAIPTAQSFGARDGAGVRRSVAAGTILSLITSVVLTVGGFFLAEPMMLALRTPPQLLAEATVFAQVTFLGASTLVFFNFLAAIIRAIGDSRTPLLYLVVSCLINVVLVIVFVGLLDGGVGGAAWATVAAQGVTVLMLTVHVRARIPVLHVERADWRVSGRELRRHLTIGLPFGFQTSIIAIGTIAVQVRLNELGPSAVAAFTTAGRVDGLAIAIMQSFGLAVSMFTAQNLGARLFDRILVGVRHGLWLNIGASIVLGGLILATGRLIVRGFIGSGSPDVVDHGYSTLVVWSLLYAILALLFVVRGALQGLGNTIVPMWSGVSELGVRIFAAVVLGAAYGYMGVVWSAPLAWVGAIVILVPAYVSAARQLADGSFAVPRQSAHTVTAGIPILEPSTTTGATPILEPLPATTGAIPVIAPDTDDAGWLAPPGRDDAAER